MELPPIYGQTTDQAAITDQVLTNINEIWSVPHEDANREYRIKTEIVVYFDDREWGNAMGECEGNPQWLPIADSPFPFKSGERVAIDGIVIPASERFVWSKTKIHVLEENVPLKAETLASVDENPGSLNGHLVSVEGLIDREQDSQTHCTLGFLSGDTFVYTYILKGTNSSPVALKPGDIVRMKCVYDPQLDQNGKLSSLGLWVSDPTNIQIIGSLATDARFDIPANTARDIQAVLSKTNLIRVAGVVHKYDAGQSVTIWDGTGQITVQSKQTQPLRFGDPVEAIGYPCSVGVREYLLNSLYRTPAPTNAAAITLALATNTLPLCLAEQIRDLSLEEAARHLPVNLYGVIAWTHRDTPFVYVLDGSGGVEVVNPKWDDKGSRKPGTIVSVTGLTDAGNFVPVVTNATLTRAGWIDIKDPQPVTLEQALTGVEEGHFVEMQGFVQNVSQHKGLIVFDLSTTSGKFQAWTTAVQPYDWFKGSIISVDGVCSATANQRHQLTGIQVWVPDTKYVQVEEPAPENLFAGQLRPLADLRRFNMESAFNQRVRTSGIVIRDEPGQCVCLQDGVDGVKAMSQQTDILKPGDRVEVVGFPAEQGQKFVLREAVYRRISGGVEPLPKSLSATNATDADLEGLLVKAKGTLLNKMEKNGETHLLVQGKGFIFEARLDSGAANLENLQNLAIASKIALTGVYEMQPDENGQSRSFLLYLRSGNDVLLLKQPPWWTTSRLLWGLAGTGVVFLVALIWGILITHKNALLHQAQMELQRAHDRLETRVEERTRELQDQVKAKELAHTELAQAQRDLMLASRQAGMAEVATGVLHNVGNVLNSVNVSASLLRDRACQSKTHSLVKVSSMLKEQNGDLASFLTSDPKGKLVPNFFMMVADELQKEQEMTLSELEQLSKNVDHIKDIVTMQQSYARVAGVSESVSLKTLAEDALQINSTPIVRSDVQVIRQFDEVPEITVDRHKVLQILINIIRNAIHALEECKQTEKQLTVRIAQSGNESVMVRVEDNGVGIPEENLMRIFSHGFTTRANGHGFGLHRGALSAREMGGSLTVASEGADQGAAFTLTLPLAPSAPSS